MSTEEGNNNTSNNEEKMSDDTDNGNTVKMTEKEVTNQEVKQIMDNIATGSIAQIPSLMDDDNVNAGNVQFNNKTKELCKHNPVETPSPNHGSDSQDEDLLLRWDDDDDLADDQAKIDDIILKEFEVFDDKIADNSTTESGLVSNVAQSNDGKYTIIPETDDINTTNEGSSDRADIIIEDHSNNQENYVSSIKCAPNNVKIVDVDAIDGEENDTSKINKKSIDVDANCDGIVNITSSDCEGNMQISDVNEIVECSTSKICHIADCQISTDLKTSSAPADVDDRNGASIPHANDSNFISIIEDNKIVQDINKISKALETGDFIDDGCLKSSVPCQEIEQGNVVLIPEAVETQVSDIIDENKIIQSINDKINTALSKVSKLQESDNQNTEQEEKSCDENIKFLEQQLKVLARSINPNLEIHTDINTDGVDTCKTISEAPSALGETVSCTAVEITLPKVDSDEKIKDDQIDKNLNPSKSEICQSIDSSIDREIIEKGTNQQMEIDVSIEKDQIDTNQNEPQTVQNIDSSKNKDLQMDVDVNIDNTQNLNEDEIGQYIGSSIEKNTCLKTDGGITILNVDQINKNLNRNDSEILVKNIDSYNEVHTQLEEGSDVNVNNDQTSKNPNEPEIVHVDSNKRNNIVKDTNINLEPEHTKQKEVVKQNAVTESNKPKKNINEAEKESDEDDDVVEIIERCDNYIDLSSQSPINLDNEVDSEIPNESCDPETPTKVVTTNNSDKIESKFHSVKSHNVKTDHRLRPDVMLEIPMHNLIDVDDIDESINIDSEETSQDSVTKVIDVKNIEEQAKTGDIKEERISAIEKEDNDVDLCHEKSEKTLKEIRNEIADLNIKIKNEPICEPVKENTIIQTEKDLNIKEENLKQASPTTHNEKIIDLDDYETPSGSKQNKIKLEDDAKPNTSIQVKEESVQLSSGFVMRMSPDTADEAPEVSDSLGLLAESSRVRREDEDMEEDEDDDDDYDQDDESSNQMTADHSEDSNAQHSEPDSKDQEDKTGDKERPFNFQPSDNTDGGEVEDEVVVEETVVSEAVGTSVDADKDVTNESTAVEKNDEQVTNDGEVTLPPTDTDTVKLSDNSNNDIEAIDANQDPLEPSTSKDDKAKEKSLEKMTQSPSKTKKLEVTTPRVVLNIVDLEESSSSEGDLQEIQELPEQEPEPVKLVDVDDDVDADVTSVNIPTGIEIMSTSCGNTSEIVTKEGEVVIQGVPKPPPHKPARLNTSEVTIKTAPASTESTLIIPEAKMSESSQNKPKLGLEIFNLDSDDDDIGGSGKGTGGRQKLTALELDAALRSGRCLRRGCTAGARGPHAGPLGHYCADCANAHYLRTQSLVEGIKNMTPLLDLNMEKLSQDLVEISDSDSDNEAQEPKETIGEAGATLLEENLAQMINGMWRKYKMDANLQDAKGLLDAEIERLDSESKEINKMLNDCQSATDKLRNELYATFEPKRQELPAISIYNTAEGVLISCETDTQNDLSEIRHGKRRLSAVNLHPAKRPAIPMGYAPLDPNAVLAHMEQGQTMLMAGEYSNRYDDDKDVSVVQLSAESAPADLPPPGEPKRPQLKPGMQLYAMRNAFGSWSRARILEAIKVAGQVATQFPSFRVRFDHKVKNPCKVLSARCLAYLEPADVRLTIGTRVIALFKEASNQAKTESYYSGIIAEIPNPVNNYRYLVFFDDGYAQYASHVHTRIVCASASPVWEEVHPFSREFVRNYLCAYPERPMVRLHAGQRLNTEWNGKWWDSRVIQVDASLAQVHFEEDNRTEWIYRGSTRLEPLFLELQAAVRHRGRHLPRSKAQLRTNMPYVEYTRSYEQDKSIDAQQEELRRQRSVAKKSTANTLPITGTADGPDAFASRVVYYTPRNAVRPYKMVAHTCGPKCKRSDVLTLKELRSYNPLAKPLLSGWERQLVRNKGAAAVLYRAPCGRRLRSARELQRYLRAARCDASIDLFDFNPDTHCLAEFVLSKCIVGKKDLSHGKENVPVPCVNSVDDSLPEFCSYNTERTPTAGVPLNLDPEFLCGCDCTDDCEDKTKCACWQMTLEGAKTIGIEGTNVGYVYKRLPEPLPSGIYECNVRCKCKATCLNRVAQHPLQLKLQVFKTPNRGWGIRALNDVPKGAFLCVYAGNLLTDATANLDGLNEGDEYLAELDYIEVVEQMKEGYEEDVPEADKILDKKEILKKEEKPTTEEEESSEEEEKVSRDEKLDDDFRPGYIGLGLTEFNKRLRKRGKRKGQEQLKDTIKKEEKDGQKEPNAEEDCITISDDEEVREPSRFTAQAGMGANQYVPKYRSVRAHFGRDEACYIMDAKVQGNIGRYLNHSCSPNVFVQNVFVDTHDPRFPWVAFFALSHIRAGTELTWNYNYDVGSVPGKVLYCYCGAPNCRRRLL